MPATIILGTLIAHFTIIMPSASFTKDNIILKVLPN